MDERYVRWLSQLGSGDLALVGGKNASLGEMIRRLGDAGVRVPGGFATTVHAYWRFLDANGLRERIAEQIDRLHGGGQLADVGGTIRRSILDATNYARLLVAAEINAISVTPDSFLRVRDHVAAAERGEGR